MRVAVAIACLALAWLATPASASAHGAVDPEASVDLARITHVPAGVTVRMVDGDLRLWMSVPRRLRVTVEDYQGAPYLRWTPNGVYANESSPMFYLNLAPPIIPSLGLTRATPPSWHRVTGGRGYLWHDGRIAALSESLAAPDATTLGRWSVPLRVDGHPTAIAGVLDHRPRPTLAWLLPAAVAVLILPALLRLRDSELDRRMARALAAVALLGASALAVGAGLHGRPGVSPTLLVGMAIQLLVAAFCAWRLVRGRSDVVTVGLVALLAFYRAISGISLLWRHYTLLAIPAPAARIAESVCLAGAIGLIPGVIVAVDRTIPTRPRRGAAITPTD